MTNELDDADSVGTLPAEFLDIPPMDEALSEPPPPWLNRTSPRLNDQTRATLVNSARDYIADLVEVFHGDGDDVRSIIDELEAGR